MFQDQLNIFNYHIPCSNMLLRMMEMIDFDNCIILIVGERLP